MTSESLRRRAMQGHAHANYVGALIEEERRMVLVSVDPDQPWEAFRRLRREMRRQHKQATMSMVHAHGPIGHSADVIPLATRRRAG